jgi:hypothetical protein
MEHDIGETLGNVRGALAKVHIFDGKPKFSVRA